MSTADPKAIDPPGPEGVQRERVDSAIHAAQKLRRHRAAVLSSLSVIVALGLVEIVLPSEQQHAHGWALVLTVGAWIPFIAIGAGGGFATWASWTSETFVLAPPPASAVLSLLLWGFGPAASGVILLWSSSHHPVLSGTGFGRHDFALGLVDLLWGGGVSLYSLYVSARRPVLKVDRTGIAFWSGGAPIPWTLMESLRLAVNPKVQVLVLEVAQQGSRRKSERVVPGPDTAAGCALEAVLRRYWPQPF